MHQTNPRTQTSDRWLPLSNTVRRDPILAAITVWIASPALGWGEALHHVFLQRLCLQMTFSPSDAGLSLASLRAQGRDLSVGRSSAVARFHLSAHIGFGMQSPCFSHSANPRAPIFWPNRPNRSLSGWRLRPFHVAAPLALVPIAHVVYNERINPADRPCRPHCPYGIFKE